MVDVKLRNGPEIRFVNPFYRRMEHDDRQGKGIGSKKGRDRQAETRYFVENQGAGDGRE